MSKSYKGIYYDPSAISNMAVVDIQNFLSTQTEVVLSNDVAKGDAQVVISLTSGKVKVFMEALTVTTETENPASDGFVSNSDFMNCISVHELTSSDTNIYEKFGASEQDFRTVLCAEERKSILITRSYDEAAIATHRNQRFIFFPSKGQSVNPGLLRRKLSNLLNQLRRP